MYKEKFVVNSTDIDSNLEIRLSALLRYMQDTATNHANKLKIGHDALEKDNNIWVVVRVDLEISRLPKLDEEYWIYTHPGETKGCIFPRFFQIYDKHKNLLVSVSSTWVVINYETRKIVLRPFPEDKKLTPEVSKDDIPLPEKVVGDASMLVDTRRARYSEVDMNGHINNTHYFDYVLDIHESDFYKKYRVSSFHINFDKEIMAGNVIEIYSNNSNPEIVHGKVNNSNSFTVKVVFASR